MAKVTHMAALLPLTVLGSALGGCASHPATSPSPAEPTLDVLLTQVSLQSTQLAQHLEYISYLSTLVPRSSAAPGTFPQGATTVLGSVTINEGACCVGGIEGEPLRIHVAFQAVSTADNVAQMSFRTGFAPPSAADIADREWGLYVPIEEFDILPPPGFSTLYVGVRFMDASGNVSPIYVDEISIEGFPPPPTGMP